MATCDVNVGRVGGKSQTGEATQTWSSDGWQYEEITTSGTMTIGTITPTSTYDRNVFARIAPRDGPVKWAIAPSGSTPAAMGYLAAGQVFEMEMSQGDYVWIMDG